MTTEELLDKIPNCKRVIKNANAEIRLLQSDFNLAEDKLNNCIRKCDEAVIELGALQETIHNIKNPIYCELLDRHYLRGQTWERIAEEMHYSSTQIYKYRPLALQEFQKVWEEKVQ